MPSAPARHRPRRVTKGRLDELPAGIGEITGTWGGARPCAWHTEGLGTVHIGVVLQRVALMTLTRSQGGGRRRHSDGQVLAAIVFATSGCTCRQLLKPDAAYS